MKKTVATIITSFILMFSLQTCYAYETDKTNEMVVIADTHGAFEEYTELLKALKLIDDKHNWIGGDRLLVSLGDNLDRGPNSRKILDLYMKLEKQGANMKLLLGNHEIMNLIGDLRYVSKAEFAAFSEDESKKVRKKQYQRFLVYSQLEDNEEAQLKFKKTYPLGYFGFVKAFSSKGRYGKWLLTKDMVANIDRNILLHGGISEQTLNTYPSISALNKALKKDLVNYIKLSEKLLKAGLFKYHFSRKDRKQVAQALVDGVIISERFQSKKIQRAAKEFLIAAETPLFKSQSPIWYRGMAFCHQYAEDRIVDMALEQYQANRILLGHTPTRDSLVNSRFDGKVILLDTGMLKSHYLGQSNAVIVKDDKVSIFNLDTPKILEPIYGVIREPQYANEKSDAYLKDYFLNATVMEEKTIAETYNKPMKLTFEYQGISHKGLFKSADSDPKLENKAWGKMLDFSDRYQNDLAAFEIDRMLGLYMTPYTQAYTYKGKKGALQFWVENSTTRTVKIEQNLEFNSYCDDKAELDIMKIFDQLIYNVDRNTGNILYTKDDGRIWLIDHSRGFRSKKPVKKHKFKFPQYVSPAFLKKLSELNYKNMHQVLGKWLHKEQIRGILSRRDRLIKYYSY